MPADNPEIELTRRLIVEGEVEAAAQREHVARLVENGVHPSGPLMTLARTEAALLANRKRLIELTGENPFNLPSSDNAG